MKNPTDTTVSDYEWTQSNTTDLIQQRMAGRKCPACGDRQNRMVFECVSEGQRGVYRAECSCGYNFVWAR